VKSILEFPPDIPPPGELPSPSRTFPFSPYAVEAKIMKTGTNPTPDPNRSTSLVHVNGESFYIVHRRMVVED